VSIVEFTTNPCHRASGEGTKCLFLSSCEITQDTNILREDVFTRANDGNRPFTEILVVPLAVRVLVRHCVFFELGKNIPDFETFFKVVVLVGIDEVFATVENDSMVLIVGLPISENGVTGEFNAEFGSAACCIGNKFAMTIDDSS